MLSKWQQFPKEEQKLGKQIAWPKGIVFTVVALCFSFLQLQAEKSKGRGICREQGAVDGSIDPKRGELPNQLAYAGMTETKNLLFYQALLWMGKFKKDESKRDGLPSGRSYRSQVGGRNSDISWSEPVLPSSDNF